MGRTSKKIQILFLMFAGLAFTAHNVIPHDHHITDSVSGKEESCPSSNGKSGHHHNFPVHCHAFNDLTSDKVTISFVPDKIRTRDVAIRTQYDQITALLQNIFISKSEFSNPFPDREIIGSLKLRAPPSLG
jgi:hypothetical protein